MIDRLQHQLRAGSGMCCEHIENTLSQKLAEQKKFGMADMIT